MPKGGSPSSLRSNGSRCRFYASIRPPQTLLSRRLIGEHTVHKILAAALAEPGR
jgi:hypothetical protein